MTDTWMPALIPVAVLLVLVVLLAKLIDLWRRRRRERAALRGAVSHAVLREERLVDTTVLPRVRIPFWEGSPASVIMTGEVPDPEARVTASRVARSAAATVRDDDRIILDGRRRSA